MMLGILRGARSLAQGLPADAEGHGRAVWLTSHFVTQMGGHSGGFLGPSSAVDFCGQIYRFVRVHLSLGESLCLRCPEVQN